MEPEPDNSLETLPGPQADDRLVHALLLHLHDGQAAENRERRVRAVLQALREPAATSTPSRLRRLPAWATRGAWAVAATLLTAVGLWMFTASPAPAAASLNDILAALGKPGDRTYRIAMVDQPAPPRPDGGDDRPPTPRPGLDNATLYLRDGRQYVLERRDPNGGVLFDGYDGRRSWRVRRGTLVEIQEGLGAGGIPMPPIMADVPFTDLHATLERVRVDYTVERLDDSPLPEGGAAWRHVRVRRNSRQVKGPETIEIWANPRTAVPRRIVFDQAKIQGNREPCRLTFDLAGESPLPADWFTPSPHTAGR